MANFRFRRNEVNLDSGCPVCQNTGQIESWRSTPCPFCNGTCEFTKTAASFMRGHPCQCIHSDRENCPLCKQKCHHGTGNKPKLLLARPPWCLRLFRKRDMSLDACHFESCVNSQISSDSHQIVFCTIPSRDRSSSHRLLRYALRSFLQPSFCIQDL